MQVDITLSEAVKQHARMLL